MWTQNSPVKYHYSKLSRVGYTTRVNGDGKIRIWTVTLGRGDSICGDLFLFFTNYETARVHRLNKYQRIIPNSPIASAALRHQFLPT
jgi:hypothetical protein